MTSLHRIRTLLLLVTAVALVTACSSSHGESDARTGNVRVMLTSSPATTTTASSTTASLGSGTTGWDDDGGSDILSRLSQVNVTFATLMARNLDGDLVDLTVDLPKTVDLIPIINGQTITLPDGTLPAGTYDQFVVVITHVEFVLTDGAKVDLTPPGGGWTKIIPVQPFEVVAGQTTTIELRFKPFHAFEAMDGEFRFFPDFECESRED
jgi:hypothetical protein